MECLQEPDFSTVRVPPDGSIALAKPPGYWHGGSTPGPHLIDWQEGRESIPTSPLESHQGGSFAAGWLLDRMEEADPPRPVLVEWLDIALSRKTLVHPLAILSRLNRMASDGSIELASRIATLLPRAWDLDSEGATRLEQTLLSRVLGPMFIGRCARSNHPS